MFSSVDIQFLGAALVAHHCLDKSTSRVRCIIDSHLNLAAFVERFSSIEPRIDQQLHSETIREMVEASQPLELGSQIPSIRPAIRFVRANGRDYVLKGSVPGSVAFFTEVELLRNMRLGRVVQMMGCGEYEFGRFRNWIVLKYYPQGNLEEYFRGLPNLKDCLLILEQVAYGIYQFQTHNYPFNVHCDLKPYNIYLEENNAFIGDFGACLVDGDMRGSGGSMVYCESRNDIVVRQQDVCSVGLIILRAFALPGLFIDGDGLTLEQWRERIKDVLARSSVWEGYSLSLFREGITAECSDVFATELLSLVNNCIKLPYQARPDIYSVVKHLRDIRCRLNFCDALPEDF
ncbi:hypothetical protein LIER_00376 [Lithospermum erythrorhizon]|uniref:Protein kinase domain-containing protein n=1 Tax=Lithospermum erythrorhizon TaxID=34254 RepID=A0AAV3NIF2_LITER